MTTKKWWLAALAVVVIIILWGVGAYNSFVRQEENIKTQLAQIDVQYQRRVDLIPNLVESVKGVLAQEQKVFLDIADARSRYVNSAPASGERVNAMNAVETGLGRLFVVMENYPQLKSNETVARLMDELAGTENRVAVERKRYNDEVNVFNKAVRVLPSKIIASVFGFSEKDLLKAAPGAEIVPKVDLKVGE